MWSLDRDPSPLPPLDNQSSVDLILKSTKVDLKTPHRYGFNQTVFVFIRNEVQQNGTMKCLTCVAASAVLSSGFASLSVQTS